jgi:hypothetical protein
MTRCITSRAALAGVLLAFATATPASASQVYYDGEVLVYAGDGGSNVPTLGARASGGYIYAELASEGVTSYPADRCTDPAAG